MSLEKLVKYSLPVFVIAIISRASEGISFFYYAVPVMCLFYIVLNLQRVKGQWSKVKSESGISGNLSLGNSPELNGDTSTPLSVTENNEYNIIHQASGILNQVSSFKDPTLQMLHRTGLPSPIIHHPLSIFLLPGIWFLITSLWSSFPEVSLTRALYYILISGGCISAGILWIRFSNKGFLDLLLPANILVILTCLFSLLTNIPFDSWAGGNSKGFMSFFGHQNLLASVLLFTMPAVLSKLQRPVNSNQLSVNSHKTNTKSLATNNYLLLTTCYLPVTAYSLLLTANLLILILTYSRASILSLIFGVILYLILNKKWKTIFFTLSVSALLAVAIYITPSLSNLAKNIINKEYPEFYTSRMWMWEPSYRAAVDGGLIGLGYGISDPKEKVGGMGDHFEGERFVREKGNSTLAMIEETGLIGLAFFLIPIIILFSKLKIKNEQLKIGTEHYKLLILNSSLAAMLIHAQFEGWWVGVGSVQLPLFFVYIGLLIEDQQIKSK